MTDPSPDPTDTTFNHTTTGGLDPATFGSTVTDNGANDEDTDIGEVCVSGLLPGDYDVTETSAPPGYGLPRSPGRRRSPWSQGPTAVPPADGIAVVTFTDPPLADIQVNFRDGGSGETSATSITCETQYGRQRHPADRWDDSVTHEDIPIDPSRAPSPARS